MTSRKKIEWHTEDGEPLLGPPPSAAKIKREARPMTTEELDRMQFGKVLHNRPKRRHGEAGEKP